MDLKTAIAGLANIGLGTALHSLRYALRRDRVERRYPFEEPEHPAAEPGDLLSAAPEAWGARFVFERAELEIRFLADDLVRASWKPGPESPPYARQRTDWPPPQVRARETEEGWLLESDSLQVLVQRNGGIRYFDAQGRLLRRECPPTLHGDRWTHRARTLPGEHVYGLGERAAPFNLHPGRYRMWNTDPGGSYKSGADPLYMCLPIYVGQHADGSYLVFFENSHDAQFSFDDMKQAQFSGGGLHYYFIPGPLPRALERYTELTGRPPLPPRWALGYHQSRWSYRSSSEVRQVLDGFRKHDLPLSAIHLDIDYMRGYRVFTVHPDRFPDLPALANELGQADVRLVAILDPGIKIDPDYHVFQEAVSHDVSCKLPDGSNVEAPVWPGRCIFPDFTNPRVRNWWGEHYPDLIDKGVAGFWHDMNEPAAFAPWGDPTLPLATQHDLEGRGGDHGQAHNLYGLLMNQAGFEALQRFSPEKRPFILSRSGWAGLQRYAWNWTGDTQSSWQALRQTIPTVLGLGMSGIPYSGPDIGGFDGSPSAELYLRWFQMATFMPFFRTHCAAGTPRREPWSYEEPFLSLVRRYLRLRYRLLPYLYTLAWETSRTGVPIVRPLFWGADAAPDLWDIDDCFLLGESLLVAPVLEPGARNREVVLPAGRWYSFWDDSSFEGPASVALDAPLENIPLLVKAGSLLPQSEGDRLRLDVYPLEEGESQAQMYSDAGDGYGPWRIDRLRLSRQANHLSLAWNHEGSFPFPYSSVQVQIHGLDVKLAWIDGEQTALEDNVLLAPEPFDELRLQV